MSSLLQNAPCFIFVFSLLAKVCVYFIQELSSCRVFLQVQRLKTVSYVSYVLNIFCLSNVFPEVLLLIMFSVIGDISSKDS